MPGQAGVARSDGAEGPARGVRRGPLPVDVVSVIRRTAPSPSVAVLSRWTGFCLPCGDDRRPLVLTWTGVRGVRAWLEGTSFTDGTLLLTCACCGAVDAVGWQDEPALPDTEDAAEPGEVDVTPDGAPVLVPVQPAVEVASPREVHAELQALLGDREEVPVLWHQPVLADAAPEPEPEAARTPAPPVVRVVQVLDLDAPAVGALRAVAEVPAPRQPSRGERRATERSAGQAPAPQGVSDEDALDVLDLVG